MMDSRIRMLSGEITDMIFRPMKNDSSGGLRLKDNLMESNSNKSGE